jgi:hypothetical protein
MVSKRAYGLAAAFLLAGCSGDGLRLPDSGDDAEYFVLRMPGGSHEAKLSPDGVSGSEVQLTRYEHSLRGRAYGSTVELNWTEEQVNGNIGGAPVDLKVEQEGSVLRIRGMYAGKVGNITVEPGKLHGTFGQCAYTMQTRQTGLYNGQVSCGGMPVDSTLQLPRKLASFYPAEIAAYLAVFLGH